MGNEGSVLSDYDIDETCYGRVGMWTLHSATRCTEADSLKVTVFIGKLKTYGELRKEFERAVEVCIFLF